MTPPQKNVRPPNRWLRRLRIFCIALVCVAMLLAGTAFYFYRNLTGMVVWFANRTHPGLAFEVKHAAFVTRSRIELRGLSLKLRSNREQVLGIEKATVDFSWRGLWAHRIESVRVENPRVSVSNNALGLGSAAQPAAKLPASPDGIWRVGQFEVVGGVAELNVDGAPLIRCEFTADFHDLFLNAAEKFSTQLQTVEIGKLQLVDKDGKHEIFCTVKSVTAHFSLQHIAQNRIDELTISAPSIRFTPALLTALTQKNRAHAKPTNSSVGAVAQPAAVWQIGAMHLDGGEFFMSGFGATTPEVSFKFGIDESDLLLGTSGDALANKMHDAQLWDVRVAAPFAPLEPYLQFDSAQVDFTAAGIFSGKKIEAVTVTGLDFQIGKTFRSFAAAGDGKPKDDKKSNAADAEKNPWMIGDLDINNSRVTLADLGVEMPNIGFNIDSALKNVALTKEIRGASKEMQEVKLSDLAIIAPHDPFVPVLNFKTIRLRFSLAQILAQEIDEVIFETPTIFIGEQLFWYVDEMNRRQSQTTPQKNSTTPHAPQNDWRINEFKIEDGRLVVANAGHASVAVPIAFSTEAQDIHFSKLSDLKLKLNLVVPLADYTFPSYQIDFKQLHGSLDFGLPAGSGKQNVVQQFFAAQARWKQFASDKVWMDVTYDVNGIYGHFGGAAYNGYLNGAFNFYMLADTPWDGWVSGSDVNLKGVTDILAPQNFQMSSPANFRVEINGLNHEVERVTGSVHTTAPGRLKMGKLDQILAAMPAKWNSIKRGITRITLETLRDFDYTSGDGDFWFAGKYGRLTLKMRGDKGARNFDVDFHGDGADPFVGAGRLLDQPLDEGSAERGHQRKARRVPAR